MLLAAPVAQFPALFSALSGHLQAHAIVTDAGSTKQNVIAAARAHLGDALPRFVPGHPIAGTEHTGARAAFATLFRDRNVVLTPLPETDPSALATVAGLWSACGAQVRELDPEVHDRIFAAVSHLPHLLAFALVDLLAARPDAGEVFRYAASGFRDFTRIAAGSPEMWRDISLANRDALLAEVDAYRAQLDRISALVAAGDGAALEAVFTRAALARRAWGSRFAATTAVPADGPRATRDAAAAMSAAATRRRAHLDLPPASRAEGIVALPGSKSISNRTLLLAALASGDTTVRGLLDADDVDRMLDALGMLGIRVERRGAARDFVVHGQGGAIPVENARLFLGNAGTAFRPLTAALAFAGGRYELSGVARMHERPIGDLVDALNALGADVRYLGRPGFPPLAIGPGRADSAGTPDRVAVRGNVSSQFTSALLMALPLVTARGGPALTLDVEGVLISKPYVTITINLMGRFGVEVGRARRAIVPDSGRGTLHESRLHPCRGRRIVGVVLSRRRCDRRRAGACHRRRPAIDSGRRRIRRRARPDGRRRGERRRLDRGAHRTRARRHQHRLRRDSRRGDDARRRRAVRARADHADRDRELARQGNRPHRGHGGGIAEARGQVDAGEDRLTVFPPEKLAPATIETYDDHRIAMCFSLATFGGVAVRIVDPECVRKTFPGYFAAFRSVSKP